jgi:hypothetical protein
LTIFILDKFIWERRSNYKLPRDKADVRQISKEGKQAGAFFAIGA